MESMDKRRYLDANIFAYYLAGPNQPENKYFAECKAVMEAGQAGEIEVVSSVVTLVEVFHAQAGPMDGDQKKSVERFFGHFYLEDVTRKIATRARDLKWDMPRELGKKHNDAMHLATALQLGIPVFYTVDRGLLALRDRVGKVPSGGAIEIATPKSLFLEYNTRPNH